MIMLVRTAVVFATGALVATTSFACSSATPSPNDGTTAQEVKAGSAPNRPPSAGCTGNGGDPTTTIDAGAACCDPSAKPGGPFPEGISCCLDNAWHPSLGAGPASTCAAYGGVGVVCEAAPTEVCGGPPLNAFCAECPGGINGYKQIDGQPTCACCASTNDGKNP